MATLNDLKEGRNKIIATRRFLYVIILLVCAGGIYFLISKSISIALFVFIVMVLIVNFVGMLYQTKGVKAIDDFLIYHALKSINTNNEKQKEIFIVKYPKSMRIKRSDVLVEKAKLPNPEAWILDETKDNWLLVFDKKLQRKE